MADALVEIASDALTAAINPFGAELTHLRDAAGCELIGGGDPAFWTGHAPLLFPIVGRLNGDAYRLDGKTYAMRQHGFARRMAWECIAHEAASATFRLTDDDETRAQYPFAFALEAAYALEGPRLAIAVTLTNTGSRDLPASFGFHPAFAWPLPYGAPREAHRLTFDLPEPAMLSPIREGLIEPPSVAAPLDGRELRLADDLFANDALVWESVASEGLRYHADGGPGLDIHFGGAPMLGIWTKPGAGFLCVEPWHGIADPLGFAGDIWDKPGMARIAPGERRDFGMQVTLTP